MTTQSIEAARKAATLANGEHHKQRKRTMSTTELEQEQDLADRLILLGVVLKDLQTQGWSVPSFRPLCCGTCTKSALAEAEHLPAVMPWHIQAIELWGETSLVTSKLTEEQSVQLFSSLVSAGLHSGDWGENAYGLMIFELQLHEAFLRAVREQRSLDEAEKVCRPFQFGLGAQA